MKNEFILNEENLKRIGACKSGISFACRNFKNMNYYDLEIKGDYCGFKDWMDNALKGTYTYDDHGNMTSLTDPRGNTVTFTYDAHGNMTSETDPYGNTVTYTYDDHGNMTSETYPDGRTYPYTYDDRGNVTSLTYPDGNTVTYAYDDRGNMTSLTYPDGNTVTYTYDDHGNMTSKAYLNGRKTEWDFLYDNNGRLIMIKEDGEIICEIGYGED